MQIRKSHVVLLILLACSFWGGAIFALSLPLEYAFRHSIMRNDLGFVGRVVSTRPFSTYEWERESVVVVDRMVFGAVSQGDTLRIGWRANRRDNGDGTFTVFACGGGSQLSELEGQSLLWLVLDEELAKCRQAPIDVVGISSERLLGLAEVAEGGPPPNSLPLIRPKDADDLEGVPGNNYKCEEVSKFLRETVAERLTVGSGS